MNKPFVSVVAWRIDTGYRIQLTEIRGNDVVIEKDISPEEWKTIMDAFHSNTRYEGHLINIINLQPDFSSLVIGEPPNG